MTRQLAITKRTPLDDIHGWEGCYVEWTPQTYNDALELKQINTTNVDEELAVRKVLELVHKHVVGGKVRIVGQGGKQELVDLEDGDIDQFPTEIINRLFAEIQGVQYDPDPKGEMPTVSTSLEEEATSGTEPTTPTSPIETPSSAE